jgi:IPT/TIG domain
VQVKGLTGVRHRRTTSATAAEALRPGPRALNAMAQAVQRARGDTGESVSGLETRSGLDAAAELGTGTRVASASGHRVGGGPVRRDSQERSHRVSSDRSRQPRRFVLPASMFVLPAAMGVVAIGVAAVVLAAALWVSLGGGASRSPTRISSSSSYPARAPSSANAPVSATIPNPTRSSTPPPTTPTPSSTPSGGGGSGSPQLESLSPALGTPGQVITASGGNFFSGADGRILAYFGSQEAPTSCPTQSTCTVTVPTLSGPPGDVPVTVTTDGGTSNALTFTYQ